MPPFPHAQDGDFTDRWRFRTFLELGALPSAVPCARLHVRQVLWEWRLAELSDVTEMLTAELITNAIQISRTDAAGVPVRLWLLADRTRILVMVWDASMLPPIRRDVTSEDETGRGLLLVASLSSQWNWYFPSMPPGGKVVWALLDMNQAVALGADAPVAG